MSSQHVCLPVTCRSRFYVHFVAWPVRDGQISCRLTLNYFRRLHKEKSDQPTAACFSRSISSVLVVIRASTSPKTTVYGPCMDSSVWFALASFSYFASFAGTISRFQLSYCYTLSLCVPGGAFLQLQWVPWVLWVAMVLWVLRAVWVL